MNESRHIVWVIPGFADGSEDDTCIPATLLLLEEFSKVEWLTISVIALHYPFKDEPYKVFGSKVHPLNGANRKFGRKKLFRKFKSTFSAIHESQAVDLIHSFWLNDAAYFADQLSISANIPHICNLMGQDARKGNSAVQKINQQTSYLTISKFHQELFFDNYKKESQVIHLGVEDAYDKKNKTIDVICVGSLIDLKNTMECILLIEKLIKDFPNITCAIVGGGPNAEKLKSEIYKRNLTGAIKMTGEVSRNKSLELIQQSKVLFHPSSYESYGMILAEAMAAQTHVVARNTGLAFEEPLIHTFDALINAAERVSSLLVNDQLPERKLYDISDSARVYLGELYSTNENKNSAAQ
jgi:glycosyltransferase involved in cell wall biosynthesis